MKKVLWLTDYPEQGSGYKTITKPICTGLSNAGYDVKLVAISNQGSEHWENFSIIPVATAQEAFAALNNLCILWKPDVLIVALDIPLQQQFQARVASLGVKYIAITPMENGPLLSSWAASLSSMDAVFFISELGRQEAIKAGLENAQHLKIGLDPKNWYPSSTEEKGHVRRNMGFLSDEVVILTVADNQERKNLWAGMKIISRLKEKRPDLKLKYVLVTREYSPYGYNLMEMANSMGIQSEVVIFERGMPDAQLRLLYVCADAFLLPTKAEGLGLPVLEALMCGVKCVATDTGAMTEMLADGVGWLVPVEYSFIDVFGNSKRDMISIEEGVNKLIYALETAVCVGYNFIPQEHMTNQIIDCIEKVVDND